MTDIERWTLHLTTHPFGSIRVEGPRGQGPIEVVRASEYEFEKARVKRLEAQLAAERGAVGRALTEVHDELEYAIANGGELGEETVRALWEIVYPAARGGG